MYLPPFAAAVGAGVGNIMASCVGINGVPGAADRRLVTDVLRGELGFDGFVVSDAGSVIDLTTHGFARDVCWLLGTSVHKIGKLRQDNLSFSTSPSQRDAPPRNVRSSKALSHKYISTDLSNEAEG